MTYTNNIVVNLEIKSMDHFQCEIVESVVAKKEKGDSHIKYTYENESGICILEFFPESFAMERKGEASVKLNFQESGEGEFQLSAYGLNQTMQIKNGKILRQERELIVSYDMYSDEEHINSLTIEIVELNKD